MRLGALFLVLVGVNVYVFFFRSGTSIRDVLKTSAIQGPALAAQQTSKDEPDRGPSGMSSLSPGDALVLRGSMKKHNGLLAALTAQQLSVVQANEIVAAMQDSVNLRALRPSHEFEIHVDPKTRHVRRFAYMLSPISRVDVQRRTDGSLRARTVEAKLDTRTVRLAGKIDSSLNRAMTKRGESAAIVARFTQLFDWDINWYADPRDGDEFRLIVEKQYIGDRFYRYGQILCAEYRGRVGRFQVYHFKHGQTEGHYTPEGRSVRRRFLKTPLNFRRISSKYNHRRFHPILHRTKGHFGVDYAAPRGTPIWAAADGKVVTAKRSGGAGNIVVLQHAGGVSTLYMHLDRFAPDLKPGMTVRQRQTIGTVGSTGLATGPHLHYGIKVRGQHVDPLRFNVDKGPQLPPAARERFLNQLPERMAALESIPTS